MDKARQHTLVWALVVAAASVLVFILALVLACVCLRALSQGPLEDKQGLPFRDRPEDRRQGHGDGVDAQQTRDE